MSVPAALRPPLLAGYASGGIAAGVSAMVPSVLLLYFMTQILVLPVGLASIAILLPKAVIIFFDPYIGRRSDQSRSRWGRRAPFMAAGALLCTLSFTALFCLPRLATDAATFVAVSAAYLAASLAWSMFGVPWTALPAEITPAPTERARLLGWRMMFVFGGMILGAAGGPVLVAKLGGGAPGYVGMALTIAPVLAISMSVTAYTARRVARSAVAPPPAAPVAMRAALPVIARFAPFAVTLGLNLLAVIGMSAFMSGAPYFIVQGLGRSEVDVAALLVAQLAASFVSMPAWGRLLPRLGFPVTLTAALGSGIGGALLVALGAHDGGWPLVLGGGALFGIGAGGIQITGLAGLTEAIDRLTEQQGVALGGTMTGLWTASERIGYALGPAVVAGILASGGFVSGAGRALQSPDALATCRMVMLYGAAPAFAVAAALALTAPAYRRLAR
ncbi:MFS transporter [Polymorphobacter arshaanensis]|uniref:MFS transporter n=1 Tax=Glacieibacterium arshaanense TaxID=2511025 RepID=A0A4Y9ESL1_9SPHN|nr:MFS transporter [Polymorphobacter arshaanensis]TFU06199.1 MFS transporter [Polymorphobacter arshaanensis]